ncbi:MAG: hypothetical protein JRD04_11185 [Deltaproteobacteria bacterium]|nr:hypothetical protein [Deltaproteobacteria bacterium]
MLIQRSIQNTARVLRNAAAEKTVEMEKRGASLEDLLPLISGLKEKEVFETGNINAGIVHCGQVAGLIRDMPSVKEAIDNIINGATEIQRRLAAEGIFQPLRNL